MDWKPSFLNFEIVLCSSLSNCRMKRLCDILCNRITLKHNADISFQEPNVAKFQSSILSHSEQQKYFKHVNDFGRSVSGWNGWRRLSLRDLCLAGNVWRMLILYCSVVIGQFSRVLWPEFWIHYADRMRSCMESATCGLILNSMDVS